MDRQTQREKETDRDRDSDILVSFIFVVVLHHLEPLRQTEKTEGEREGKRERGRE